MIDTRYADLRLRSLSLARECAVLGARPSTIASLTGISHGEVLKLFFDSRVPRGIHPTSIEWFFSKTTKIVQVECAIFASLLERLREAGHASSQALVGAYKEYVRCYRHLLHTPAELQKMNSTDSLTFDRAFYLAANLALSCASDGALWLMREPALFLQSCSSCRGRFVASSALVRKSSVECPTCWLQDRFYRHKDIRERFASTGAQSQLHVAPPP